MLRTSGKASRKKGLPIARVLLFEENSIERQSIADYLSRHYMSVLATFHRQDVTNQLRLDTPSIVILDLRYGQEDGFEFLRDIRRRSDVPVIVTTDHQCGEMDGVIGLELGADDHVTKPFCLRELAARVRAVLRRSERRLAMTQSSSERCCYRFGDWRLDRLTRRLTDPNGDPVALTKGECTLLTAFLDAPQRPLPRGHLRRATRVHGDVFDRSIDAQIHRLRHKLEIGPKMSPIIRTVHGVGYVFDLPVLLVGST
jgi:two-component system, OmpR family, response regulator